MTIEESVVIRAPQPVVWEVFSRLEGWSEWNSVCRDCCLLEGEGMSRGACFTFTLRLFQMPIRVETRVTRYDPGREVVWEGRRLGIGAEHRFSFKEQEGAVLVTSVEQFSGPLLWLCRLLGVPLRLHRLSRRFLQEIKNQAERCGSDVSA